MTGKRKKRIIELLWNGYILMLVVLLLLFVPGWLGLHLEAVASGSMEPSIRTGSLLYVKPASFEELSVGDIITYYIEDGSTKVTHRVVEKLEEAEAFRTKGDANPCEDSWEVPYDAVEGTVLCAIPWIGYVAVWIGSGCGKAVLLLVLVVLYGMTCRKPSACPVQKETETERRME
jgi:signal peptidase I